MGEVGIAAIVNRRIRMRGKPPPEGLNRVKRMRVTARAACSPAGGTGLTGEFGEHIITFIGWRFRVRFILFLFLRPPRQEALEMFTIRLLALRVGGPDIGPGCRDRRNLKAGIAFDQILLGQCVNRQGSLSPGQVKAFLVSLVTFTGSLAGPLLATPGVVAQLVSRCLQHVKGGPTHPAGFRTQVKRLLLWFG